LPAARQSQVGETESRPLRWCRGCRFTSPRCHHPRKRMIQ